MSLQVGFIRVQKFIATPPYHMADAIRDKKIRIFR